MSVRRREPTALTSPLLPGEVWAAVGVFAAMCVAVLVKAPQLLEPDDFAYRASIVALSQGHVLLSNAQFLALYAQLSAHGGGGIYQWVHLANGQWISQKNPGYPFFAVVFQWLHALRWAPLFYGALGCAGLFYGSRRWLGRWGGTIAVALYCTSGAALNFAWRAQMPTFSDASLIAGAAGLLLGVLLGTEESETRRLALGALAFLALDGAVLIRYTNVAVLIVAAITVVALARAASVTRAMLLSWFAVVVVFALGDLELNHALYGGFMKTGYASGLITFGTSAIIPNLERMPVRLVESMPVVLLALGALAWIAVRLAHAGPLEPFEQECVRARRDATVALFVAAGWFGVWGLYATYTWTVGQTLGPNNPVHVVRFYLPALGLIALLAAWLVAQLPRWLPAALIAVLAGLGLWSYQTPANHIIGGPSYGPVTPIRSPAGQGPAPVGGPTTFVPGGDLRVGSPVARGHPSGVGD
jgi:hypothetical protein